MDTSRNETSFEAFYRRHRAWSRALVRRMLSGTDIDWEDKWSEAWGKFAKSYLDSTFVYRISPEAYLRRCLANQAMDALRRHQHDNPILFGNDDELLSDDSEPVDELIATLDAEINPATPARSGHQQELSLVFALSQLSPMQRTVITLWSCSEPSATDKEIGEELGISESTAKTHRKRALDNLRRCLKQSWPNSPEEGGETA